MIYIYIFRIKNSLKKLFWEQSVFTCFDISTTPWFNNMRVTWYLPHMFTSECLYTCILQSILLWESCRLSWFSYKSSLTHSLVSGWSHWGQKITDINFRLGLNSLVRKSYYNQTRLHIPDLIVCDIHPLLGSSCRDCIIKPTYFQVQSYISTKFDKFYFLYLPNLFLI